jgi:hypothetical protein
MNEDERIAAMFAAPEPAPDEAFVARIERAVRAEQRLAGARLAAWRRFAVECAASAAIVTAFDLVWRLGPAELPLAQLPVAPAAAVAILVLALWFAVELRPSATGR